MPSSINALFKDFHSHMALTEVMGYLGGTYDSNTKGEWRRAGWVERRGVKGWLGGEEGSEGLVGWGGGE